MKKRTPRLSHVDSSGAPAMVDVGAKSATRRTAHAVAIVALPREVARLLSDGEIQSAKGPVFQTASLAGVMGAKRTAELIPLCHPLRIDDVNVAIEMCGADAEVHCRVSATDRTGVEMEALTGASVAALTIYDMCKAVSHGIRIREVRLLEKTGGKNDFRAK
jgi:cyclic pyranopterin monophosphate synthase